MRFYFPIYFDVVGTEKAIWILDRTTLQKSFMKMQTRLVPELILVVQRITLLTASQVSHDDDDDDNNNNNNNNNM